MSGLKVPSKVASLKYVCPHGARSNLVILTRKTGIAESSTRGCVHLEAVTADPQSDGACSTLVILTRKTRITESSTRGCVHLEAASADPQSDQRDTQKTFEGLVTQKSFEYLFGRSQSAEGALRWSS